MTDLDLEILLDHSRMYRAVVARVAARQTGDSMMSKNLTLHTPTPWKVEENGYKTQFIYGSDATQKKSPMGIAYNELVAGGNDSATLNAANAAFIVRAANAHDILVKALNDLHVWCEIEGCGDQAEIIKDAFIAASITEYRCSECDGAGEWDEGPLPARHSAQIDPDYRQVVCPSCKGAGRISLAKGEA